MTSQQLLETLRLIVEVDAKLLLQTSLNSIRDSLANLAGQPAQTQFQANLASAEKSFFDGWGQLRSEITPIQFAAIAELGGHEFFE
jgi:hypothetical protein